MTEVFEQPLSDGKIVSVIGHSEAVRFVQELWDEAQRLKHVEVTNRKLGDIMLMQEGEIRELRQALLVAAGALKVAGYHTSAEAAMQAWKDTA